MSDPAVENLRIRFVDTHTGGEPTRIITDWPIDLPVGAANCRDFLRREHDDLRRAIVCEPRGSSVLVGAFVVPPAEKYGSVAVVFVNNVGYLGMCGHGTAGLAVALRHLGIIQDGRHRLETVAGLVDFEMQGESVTLTNVASYLFRRDVEVKLNDRVTIRGDVAYGGNWFFICDDHAQRLELDNVEQLMSFSREVRSALTNQGITGKDGAEIDHIELSGPPSTPAKADCRNFVLCPGSEYDRSPCGTGTSAKVACLAARGVLAEGELFRQESIVGSVFEASFARLNSGRFDGGGECANEHASVVVTIRATAHVISQGELLLQADDPLRMGL
ncbi:MAG: 4-hydroxyproline epimerase [Aureliella sp.]